MEKLTVDEILYQKAKEYCRTLKFEQRGDLYYALLDWCDKHDDIKENLAKKYDKYELVYIDKNGESHREEFMSEHGENPYKIAKERCSELFNESIQVIEFRHCPNPYLSYPDRMGSLIFSKEFY